MTWLPRNNESLIQIVDISLNIDNNSETSILKNMLTLCGAMQRGTVRATLHRVCADRLTFWSYIALAQRVEPRISCNFFTVSVRLASKKARHASGNSHKPSKPARPVSMAFPNNSPTYKSYAQTIALRQSPTLLYQSSSHMWFISGCYLMGGFCFAWAGLNFHMNYLYPPEGTWTLLPNIMVGVCVFMTVLGGWFIRRVSYLLQNLSP